MPKKKSHSGTKKRYKLTAKGKVKARAFGRIHNMKCKSGRKVRKMRKGMTLSGERAQKLRELL